jgi:hypothetical protein
MLPLTAPHRARYLLAHNYINGTDRSFDLLGASRLQECQGHGSFDAQRIADQRCHHPLLIKK